VNDGKECATSFCRQPFRVLNAERFLQIWRKNHRGSDDWSGQRAAPRLINAGDGG
jgi:hypothetical protein